MKIIGIVPARLKSSRLPDKALLDIEGLPMVVHVLKRAQLSKSLSQVLVATDSQKIFDVIKAHGGEAMMTSDRHPSGTDRIAEAASNMDADIVVNVQGDEPLLVPEHIDTVIKPLIEDKDIPAAVLVTPYRKRNSPSDFKAVLDKDDNILYCSRADLPSDARQKVDTMWKMCFIVPYRKPFLLDYASGEPTPLERVEYCEHLRILEKGYPFRAVKVDHAPISVDTPDDLKKVRELMKKDTIKSQYLP